MVGAEKVLEIVREAYRASERILVVNREELVEFGLVMLGVFVVLVVASLVVAVSGSVLAGNLVIGASIVAYLVVEIGAFVRHLTNSR